MKDEPMQRNASRQRRLRVAATAGISALVVAASGCSFDPASVPLPGTGVSGESYRLHIEFANALNLPAGARVLRDGVEVGKLTGVRISENGSGSGHVVADIDIRNTVRLPGDTTAELQQATPLGDVHIALVTDPNSLAAPMPAEATIPLSRTAQTPQVEDTLAGLATALGSGAITDIQDTVRRLNSALPSDPAQTTRMFATVGQDLMGVADDLSALDRVLDGLNRNADTVLDQTPLLQRILTDPGVDHLSESVDAVIRVFYIFTNLAPVAHSAVWLAPVVQNADAAATALVPLLLGNRPLDLRAPTNLKALVDLIQNKLIPFGQRPAVDLVRVGVSPEPTAAISTTDRTDQVIAALRMIGAVR